MGCTKMRSCNGLIFIRYSLVKKMINYLEINNLPPIWGTD